MDTLTRRLGLLRAFYAGLPLDRLKLESRRHGFAFLGELLRDGAVLDYGELTLHDLLHKYKLSSVPAGLLDRLLRDHLSGEANVCLYFGPGDSPLACFNLDDNRRTDNTAGCAAVDAAVQGLRVRMESLGCPPLIIASGRGYHAWLRLDAAVPRGRLHGFMLRVAAAALARVHGAGHDMARVKFNFYPDPRTHDTVSLRLFGTTHAKTGRYSLVLGPDGRLLDEEASWASFEALVRAGPLPVGAFEAACAALGVPAGDGPTAPDPSTG